MPGSEPERVLFIGNSYTFCNRMPGTLEQLVASAAGARPIATEVVASGGWTLEQHWDAPASRAVLERGGWDRVVLQEQTRRPFEDRDAYHRGVRRLDQRIRELGASTVLYLTWATSWEPERQADLDASVRAIGAEIGAPVVPVGPAFAAARATAPDSDLYVASDRRHPSARGSYLAACTFFGAMRGRSPVGLAASGWDDSDGTQRPEGRLELPAEEARALQAAAWSAVGVWR